MSHGDVLTRLAQPHYDNLLRLQHARARARLLRRRAKTSAEFTMLCVLGLSVPAACGGAMVFILHLAGRL